MEPAIEASGPQALDRREMRWNVLGGYVSKGATLLTALVTTRILLQALGAERFGLATAFWQILLLVPIGDLGVGSGMTITLARALGVQDDAAARRTVSTGFFLLCGIGAAMFALCLMVLPMVPWADINHLKTEVARAEALPSALVMFLSWSVIVPLNIGIILLNANRETFRYNIWFSMTCPLQIGFTLWFVAVKAPLPAIVFTSSGLYGFLWIALAAHEFGFRKRWLVPSWKLVDKETAWGLLSLGWKLLLGQTGRTALIAADAIVMGMVFGAASIPAFSLVSRLFFMGQVSQYAMNAWSPAFAASFEQGGEAAAHRYFKMILTKYSVVTAVLSVVLFFTVDPILKLWVGDAVPPAGFELRLAFVFWTVTWALVDAISTYANAGRHVRFGAFSYTIAVVFVCLAKLALAKVVGPVGIVWAFTGGMLVLFVLPMSFRLGLRPTKVEATTGRRTG